MTTPDQTRPADVDPLVLTAPAHAGQRVAAFAVDVGVPLLLAVAAGFLFVGGNSGLGVVVVLVAVAWIGVAVGLVARTGRSLGRIAASTRTVRRSTGAAAGASLLPAFFSGGLGTFDVHRGRDPFAPALAAFEFPVAEPAPLISALPGLTRSAPVVVLDSGQTFSLDSPLVLGRNPAAPVDAPAQLHRWVDLSRTLSKSHARLEWDGRLAWVTDLGSTNGTILQAAGVPHPLLPFQRTPLPAEATLELGDRVIIVKAPA